ncbi:14762_t:CDS:2 [Funneliformis geosporum]|uniref:Small ribosomal subunit protein mS41 n=1 Tax=Funneliformis geosporum TaxID=1117311 RepID=A0A9W4SXD1_9GLOM|nr:14762_t:CDS:2 [Funneliformis geosporum]CAI2184913.1 8140_t:CDS:2 [Funneliformis geosporum]
MILLKNQFPQLLFISCLTKKFYLSLGNKLIIRNIQNKQKSVPEPRGRFKDPKTFLEKCGRGCGELADKFRDWEHLFTASSYEMKSEMGISTRKRRWILDWTEQYRKGVNPYNIPIRTRRKKKK